MANNLNYDDPHFCPAYDKVIDIDLCYESLMALGKMVKISSVPELDEIEDIETARKVCAACPYSDLS